MLSEEETLAAAGEALEELNLENRLSVDEVGWPGAAGVLWVRFDDSAAGAPLTVFVPWEQAAETADEFRRKLKEKIVQWCDPPDPPL